MQAPIIRRRRRTAKTGMEASHPGSVVIPMKIPATISPAVATPKMVQNQLSRLEYVCE